MEREELLGQVIDALESEGRTLTLSEETINGELDDALEGVTDDAQVDETFVGRIVKRLKRMDGQLHKDVSTQVKAYKKAHPAPKTTQTSGTPKNGEGEGNGVEDDDEPAWAKKLNARLDAMEQNRPRICLRISVKSDQVAKLSLIFYSSHQINRTASFIVWSL